jgi:hypothetical protein
MLACDNLCSSGEDSNSFLLLTIKKLSAQILFISFHGNVILRQRQIVHFLRAGGMTQFMGIWHLQFFEQHPKSTRPRLQLSCARSWAGALCHSSG